MSRLLSFFKSDGYKHARFSLDGKTRFEEYTHGMYGANAVAAFALANSTPEHKELAKEQLQRLWDSKPPSGKYRYYDGMVYYLSWLHVAGSFALNFKH